MNKFLPCRHPHCRLWEHCVRYGSEYCFKCFVVTQDERDNSYYIKEMGD